MEKFKTFTHLNEIEKLKEEKKELLKALKEARQIIDEKVNSKNLDPNSYYRIDQAIKKADSND